MINYELSLDVAACIMWAEDRGFSIGECRRMIAQGEEATHRSDDHQNDRTCLRCQADHYLRLADAVIPLVAEACSRTAYSSPDYIVGGVKIDAETGVMMPGSPYDRGRFDAMKDILSRFCPPAKEKT